MMSVTRRRTRSRRGPDLRLASAADPHDRRPRTETGMPRFNLPWPPPDWEDPKEWRIGREDRILRSGWAVTTETDENLRFTRFRPCVPVRDASGKGRWNAAGSRIRIYVEPVPGSRALLLYRLRAGPEISKEALESFGQLHQLYIWLRGGTKAQISARLRRMFPHYQRQNVAELAEAVWRVLMSPRPWQENMTPERRSRYLNRAIRNELRRLGKERIRRENEPVAQTSPADLERVQEVRSRDRVVIHQRIKERFAVLHLNDKESRLADFLTKGYGWTEARRMAGLSASVETTLRRKLKGLPK